MKFHLAFRSEWFHFTAFCAVSEDDGENNKGVTASLPPHSFSSTERWRGLIRESLSLWEKNTKQTGSTSLSLCTTGNDRNTSCALWGCIKRCMPPIDLCQQTVGTVATLMGLWCTTQHSRAAESACQWVIFFLSFFFLFLSSQSTGWRVRFWKAQISENNSLFAAM